MSCGRCEKSKLPELYDVNDVATWLRKSPKAIRNMRDRGQLPRPIQVGRRLLWSRADLDKWFTRAVSPSE